MPLEVKGRHLRYRVRRPFKSAKYRTHDVGSKGHTKRVVCYNPRTKKWTTQSWLFPVKDIKAKRKKTMEILSKLGIKRKALKKVV